jgi:aquaporin Z
MNDLARKCLAEATGTFCLVFAGTGAIVIDDLTKGGVSHIGVALTFGLIVMAMIYAIGDISGAHINPAVTIAFWLAARFRLNAVLPYLVSQVAGSLAASLAIKSLFGVYASLGATLPAGSARQSFALEAILTGILMFVILCVATGPKEVGVMAGIAVGGIIALEALFAGPISGASMNPARSLAPAICSGNVGDLWVYLLAPVFGAAAAVPLWRAIRVDRQLTPETPLPTESTYEP